MTLALVLAALLHAQTELQPPESFPVIETLPDPFLFQDGRHVATVADWQQRREEMRELLLCYEYGHVPPAPDDVSATADPDDAPPFSGQAQRRMLRLAFGPDHRLSMKMRLYLPQHANGPHPVIVRFGIDEGPVAMLAARGYAYACFDHQDLDPDTEGHDVVGPAQAAYPESDWGSLAVWAWGASRVLDYLVTLPEINVAQVVITGHSRTGKAALLAGALDDRFTMVVPNGSGCGGAAAFRDAGQGVETLDLITQPARFQSWFQKDFRRFAGFETRLPFDQHFMRALVAPRVVLSTDGLDDLWANPPGTRAAWKGAQPVFEYLGAGENNLCHFRPGGHDQLPADYEVLLDTADEHFKRGKWAETPADTEGNG